MSVPLVSVILPVRDGAATIRVQLDALGRQETERVWELIVVDNGSSDDTVVIVADAVLSLPNAQLLEAGQVVGASHAKNRGAALAVGEVLLFCDADDEVDEQWLSRLADGVENHGFAGGSIDRRRLCEGDPTDLRVPVTKALHLTADGHIFAVGANMGVTRALFESIDGFDTDFVGGNEDADFALRAASAGSPPVFVADAIVHYRDRRGWLARFRQYQRYGLTEAQLFDKHRSILESRRPAQAVYYWTRVASLAASSWRHHDRRVLAVRLAGRGVGRVRGSVKHRVFFF